LQVLAHATIDWTGKETKMCVIVSLGRFKINAIRPFGVFILDCYHFVETMNGRQHSNKFSLKSKKLTGNFPVPILYEIEVMIQNDEDLVVVI